MSHKEAFSHLRIASKLPVRQGVLRGAALAMIGSVALCPLGGCLVPQSVEPIVAVPHPPPHFVVETIPSYLLPPMLTLIRQGSADAASTPPCHCQLDFTGLVVEEDDSTVTLEARWFIDYDVADVPTTRPWSTETLQGNFDDVTAVQRTLGTFSLDADSVGIVTSGSHVVEVVVGEKDGFDPASTTLPNRGMKAGYTPAIYRFFVDVHVEQVAGQCPQTPPSSRVCR